MARPGLPAWLPSQLRGEQGGGQPSGTGPLTTPAQDHPPQGPRRVSGSGFIPGVRELDQEQAHPRKAAAPAPGATPPSFHARSWGHEAHMWQLKSQPASGPGRSHPLLEAPPPAAPGSLSRCCHLRFCGRTPCHRDPEATQPPGHRGSSQKPRSPQKGRARGRGTACFLPASPGDTECVTRQGT